MTENNDRKSPSASTAVARCVNSGVVYDAGRGACSVPSVEDPSCTASARGVVGRHFFRNLYGHGSPGLWVRASNPPALGLRGNNESGGDSHFGAVLLPLAMVDAHDGRLSTIVGGAIPGGVAVAAGLGVITPLAQSRVRRAFEWAGPSGLQVPSIWMRLIAMADLIASPFEISAMLSSRSRLVFGLAITAAPLSLYRVALAGLLMYVGRGLYRMNSSVRRLAIGCSVYSTAENLVWSIVTPTPHGGFSFMRAAGCLIGTALSGLIV